MKKNDIIENIFIEKLIFGGKGLARADDGRKIIITGGVIPESTVKLRIIKIKSNYIEAQLLDVIKKSPLEESLPFNFQVYGGCKWLPIKYDKQLEIKENQVKESLNNIREFLHETKFHKIIPSPEIYGYRNKLEFSFGKYISERENIFDDFRFGFHKQGEFDKIINCEYCVLGSEEINTIFKEIDKFCRSSKLPTYDQKTQKGFWRHLVVRNGYYSKEIMLIFSINNFFPGFKEKNKKEIIDFLKKLPEQFKNIKSIYLLDNPGKADIVQGNYNLIYGSAIIKENLLDITFEINPKSFFQVNSAGAEKLYNKITELIGDSKGILLDLYAGTGTIGIILARKFKKIFSIEIVKEATLDAEKNAITNGINNIEFINSSVENFLKDYLNRSGKSDVLILDPPRDGINPNSLPDILKFNSKIIIYVSCNPASLGRDLNYILKNSNYKITDVVPVDMFPHTHHIETIVKLIEEQDLHD